MMETDDNNDADDDSRYEHDFSRVTVYTMDNFTVDYIYIRRKVTLPITPLSLADRILNPHYLYR